MPSKYQILHQERGIGAVEFALTAPVLLGFIVGVAQLGTLFFANSGLKSAVAEGARYATIHPRPSDAQIIQRISDGRFGLDPAHITGPTITRPAVGPTEPCKRECLLISMSYNVPLDFIFFSVGPVRLTEARRVFVYPVGSTPAPPPPPPPPPPPSSSPPPPQATTVTESASAASSTASFLRLGTELLLLDACVG